MGIRENKGCNCGIGRTCEKHQITFTRTNPHLMTPTDYQSKVLARVDFTINAYGDFECDELSIAKALRVAVEMCSVNGYTTWDKSMVPLIDGKYDEKETNQWEIIHGHDIRLKCYPEFGCQLLIDPEDLLTEIAKELGI